MNYKRLSPVLTGIVLLGLAFSGQAEDWPMWRQGPERAAYSTENLPPNLHLQWVRQYSPRAQVWDDPLNHDLMPYDKVFEPVVLGRRLLIGFNDTDKVVALDIETGRELWRFYTDGPVRLPPAAGDGKVYFTSDDGHLYCLNVDDGTLLWKFRGGPAARKVLGNRRVISAWPARGGPVLRDGTVYFAASIWPFMGTFIYALNATTGEIVWVNDGTGAQYIKQPHSAASFAGVAPQGALVATKEVLLVPGGRSVPAAFDRKTGRFLHFKINDGGKGNGGSLVMAHGSKFFVHTRNRGVREFDLKTGKKGSFTINEPVLGTRHYYAGQDHSHLQEDVLKAEDKLAAARYSELKAKSELRDATAVGDAGAMKKAKGAIASARKKISDAQKSLDKAKRELGSKWPGKVVQAVGLDKKIRWEIQADGTGDIIKAGNRLYAAGEKSIVAIQIPAGGRQPKVVWSHPVQGRVLRLLAANGRLFAVTLDGRILAFGGGKQAPVTLRDQPAALTPTPTAAASARAQAILAQPGAREGYALWFGVEDQGVLDAVIAQSKLRIVAVEPDAAKVEQLRRRFDAAGLYGLRVTVHQGEPATFAAPPYVANLVVVSGAMTPRLAEPQALQAVYASVRPYGGTLWLNWGTAVPAVMLEQINAAHLPQAEVNLSPGAFAIVRQGPLPESADWTHQYGNMANTVKSDDGAVKLPLGVLWFGGNSHRDVLPRHGHGPSEQVVGGRLFIQGMNSLSARDVYTGRPLWKVELPELNTYGIYYDETYKDAPLSTLYNQKHIPGANARGANYVATADAVYVVEGSTCRVLSARTGETRRTIAMPTPEGQSQPPQWGYIGIEGDILFGGMGFANFNQRFGSRYTGRLPGSADVSASSGLVAFDRHTGKVLWSARSRHGFVHNGIVAGNNRLYCLDRLPRSVEDRLKRRGQRPPSNYRVLAFDLRSGQLLWEQQQRVFGTWLGYSAEHDLLLQAGATAKDRSRDEVGQGMATYRGKTGVVVWSKPDLKYNGPCIIHHELVMTTPDSKKTSSGVFNLLDGNPYLVTNPLTGQREPWKISRDYGCNYPVASEHLLTFRSGAAGFYDLDTFGGTGNFGGFKSGCSPNLIAANGVLNAPDYTRTCSCPYQNQTSLALVHMPELEVWTYNLFGAATKAGQAVRQVGINFGAPGDRRSAQGTLWMDYPSVGGSSATIPVKLQGEKPEYFRRYAMQIAGEGLPWVAASGVRHVTSVSITPRIGEAKPAAAKPKSSPSSEPDYGDDDDNGHGNGHGNGSAASPGATANHVASAQTSPSAGSPAQPRAYTVRLYFSEPDPVAPGQRVFNVALQGRTVLTNFDIAALAGGRNRGVMKEFRNVAVPDALTVTLNHVKGSQYGAVISGIELIAEDNGLSLLKPNVK